MKVIMTARDIPYESVVTKQGGTKRYVLKHTIRLFDQTGIQRELASYEDSRIIMSDRGDGYAVSGATELVWHVSACTLRAYLEAQADRSEQ